MHTANADKHTNQNCACTTEPTFALDQGFQNSPLLLCRAGERAGRGWLPCGKRTIHNKHQLLTFRHGNHVATLQHIIAQLWPRPSLG